MVENSRMQKIDYTRRLHFDGSLTDQNSLISTCQNALLNKSRFMQNGFSVDFYSHLI